LFCFYGYKIMAKNVIKVLKTLEVYSNK